MISKLKLEILALLCNPENVNVIVPELKYYALTVTDQATISEAVQAIGRCVTGATDSSSRILTWLLRQVASKNAALVSESLNVIRYLVLRDPTHHIETVGRLARLLDQVTVPEARSCLIWLVGEFAGVAPGIAPDVLRKSLQNFVQETTSVRYQVVVLAAKVYSYSLDREKKEGREEPEPESKRITELLGM